LALIRAELLKRSRRRGLQEWRLLRRFTITVLAGSGVSPRLCVWYVGCSLSTVRRWSVAVQEAKQLLDKPRRGRQPVFDEALQLKLIGFYCQSPLSGCARWSISWAASYLNKHLQILGRSISKSTIHRTLRRHSLRPHLLRYFLHISDPDFFAKMEHLIELYIKPPRHLFCLDECNGIQALQRLALPIVSNNGTRLESEYKRRGTRDFIGILEVATGEVFGHCTPNHLKETVAEVFSEHVAQQPAEAVLHYICDNLAAHSTEVLCEAVAELSGVSCPRLKTAEKRRRWLQSEEKRIIVHFTPYHGSWLNLIEIWFAILHTKCLKARSFDSVEQLSEAILCFRDTWNEHFAHPFKWAYRGEGLAEKVVRRFCQWLTLEADSLTQKFLHKQLRLLLNLARDYWPQVPQTLWQNLQHGLADHENYLQRCIDGSQETEDALAELIQHLDHSSNQQALQEASRPRAVA
jgi:transposase